MTNLTIISVSKEKNNMINLIVRYKELTFKLRGLFINSLIITECKGLINLDESTLFNMSKEITRQLNKNAKKGTKEVELLTQNDLTLQDDIVYSFYTENNNLVEITVNEGLNYCSEKYTTTYEVHLYFNGCQQNNINKCNQIFKQLAFKGVYLCPFENVYCIDVID